MKYSVVEVIFKQASPSLGGSAWFKTASQGGYESCEYDTDTGLLTLSSPRPGIKKRRVHVSNTLDMVFGPTQAGSTSSKSSGD